MILPHDMECMKMAMLKHEETFKQQVYELHRLYQTQRILMKNLQLSMLQNQETQSLRNPYVYFEYQNDFNTPQKQDHMEHPASNEYHIDGVGSTEIENECDIELTLGPTSYTRRNNNLALTRHLNLDSMPSFSSSSTGLSHKTRENFDRSLNQPHWLRRVLI